LSILYAEKAHETQGSECQILYNKNIENPAKEEKVYMLSENQAKLKVPGFVEEMLRSRYYVFTGTIKAYAPSICQRFLNEDKQCLNLAESLKLSSNLEKIRQTVESIDIDKLTSYVSYDEKIIIKIISEQQKQTISEMFENYLIHLQNNPKSLLTRIYGLYTLDQGRLGKTNILLIRNPCHFSLQYLEKKYEMNGFSNEKVINFNNKDTIDLKSVALKEKDFELYERKIQTTPVLTATIYEQIIKDIDFLEKNEIVGYRLAVYFGNREKFDRENQDKSIPVRNELKIFKKENVAGVYYCIEIIDYFMSSRRTGVNNKPVNHIEYSLTFRKFCKKILGR